MIHVFLRKPATRGTFHGERSLPCPLCYVSRIAECGVGTAAAIDALDLGVN